jgi:hypothetical protein
MVPVPSVSALQPQRHVFSKGIAATASVFRATRRGRHLAPRCNVVVAHSRHISFKELPLVKLLKLEELRLQQEHTGLEHASQLLIHRGIITACISRPGAEVASWLSSPWPISSGGAALSPFAEGNHVVNDIDLATETFVMGEG